MPAILIEGRCVLPTGVAPSQVLIQGDRIAAVGRVGAADIRYPDDALVFPGFIDIHVHAREDTSGLEAYKEDYVTASRAAIHGGVTAIADMPNNPEPPADAAAYEAKRRLSRAAAVDVLLYAALAPGAPPLPWPVPYKAFVGTGPGGLHFSSTAALSRTLEGYRGQWVAFHAESAGVLLAHRGADTHEDRRPPQAEIEAIRTVVGLVERWQVQGHICHLSTASGLDIVLEARSRGAALTCEVTPHHLYFDRANRSVAPYPDFLRMNPPLRGPSDRSRLLAALRAGEIDALATDHAPHTPDDKVKGAAGVPHLDTYGSFVGWLMSQGVSPERIARIAAEIPGAILGRFLPGRFGRIVPGAVASLTVLDPTQAVVVSRDSLRTKCAWSPFEGLRLPARVVHTIVRGRVYDPGTAEIVAEAG